MSGKFLVALFISTTLVYYVTATPALSSDFIEQENSCREVCGLCNCDGFYCIDECICECSVKDEENLECIADMKKECDKNGLEYELLMQESTKERFLRQIKSNPLPFTNFANSFVILKQKREQVEEPAERSDDEPVVGAPAPKEKPKIVIQPGYEKPKLVVQPGYEKSHPGAAAHAHDDDDDDQIVGAAKAKETVGFPLTIKAAALDGKMAIAGLRNFTPGKLLISLRDNAIPARKPVVAPLRSQLTKPAAPALPALPSLPSFEFPSKGPAAAATFPSLPPIKPISSFKSFDGILGKPLLEKIDAPADED